MKRLIVLWVIVLTSVTTQATASHLNETLVRIINQINAIKPLLDEAQAELSPAAPVQLHIDGFHDAEGHYHAGLRDDLLAIRNGLIDYINQPVIAPCKVTPLALDFVEKT